MMCETFSLRTNNRNDFSKVDYLLFICFTSAEYPVLYHTSWLLPCFVIHEYC